MNPSGTQTANDTTYRFEYGPPPRTGRRRRRCRRAAASGATPTSPVSGVLGGLAPETEYHYRVVASNGHGTTYGRDRTFRTGATPAPQGAAVPRRQPPRLALSAPRTIKRAKLLKNGVRVTVAPNEPSALELELVGSTGRSGSRASATSCWRSAGCRSPRAGAASR